jgi:hypothetical protein
MSIQKFYKGRYNRIKLNLINIPALNFVGNCGARYSLKCWRSWGVTNEIPSVKGSPYIYIFKSDLAFILYIYILYFNIIRKH